MALDVLFIALAAAIVAALVVSVEWLVPRLHDEEWLLQRAVWSFHEWDDAEWVATDRHAAEGMHPVNAEARELVRRWGWERRDTLTS